LKRKILIVDDKINTLKVLCTILEDEGYDVIKAQGGREALSLYEKAEHIDVVLADLKMPEMNGLELFHRLRSMKADVPFLIMTAHGTVASAVEAMKQGVSNYLIKPLNYDELNLVLERALHEKKISDELADLRREIRTQYAPRNIIGAHPKMRRIFEMLATVAPTDAPVLISGETGTGKELLAKAIHASSNRYERPMVCINSAAIADSLLEAELFGYKKGAFTGALSNKKGRLETADGGTLFLDEIGYMSMNLQKKLLRFLQEGSFEPLGSVTTRYVDVRIITATNRNLNDEIKARRFLADLLYRIEVLTITLPPLRERGEDLQLLATHFVKQYAERYRKVIAGIDPAATAALVRHSWPGNVRELENCIARGVILSKDRQISLDDLPEKIRVLADTPASAPGDGFLREVPEEGIRLKTLEREVIQKTLEHCKGNKTKSAEMLGLSRKTLYEKIERFKLEG
jgi:DNA-binding NtrC family response regulator